MLRILRATGVALTVATVATAALIVSGLTASAAPAPTFSRDLDLARGFAVDPASRASFGYISQLRIGGSVVGPSYTVHDQTRPPPDPTKAVVSVLRNITWRGRQLDPIQLRGVVSAGSRDAIQQAIRNAGGDGVPVTIVVTAYGFDYVSTAYYGLFETAGPGTSPGTRDYSVNGVLRAVTISADPTPDVSSPTSYDMTLALSASPLGQPQRLRLGTSVGRQSISPWGGSSS